jgi:AraC-like DNA-binding protein
VRPLAAATATSIDTAFIDPRVKGTEKKRKPLRGCIWQSTCFGADFMWVCGLSLDRPGGQTYSRIVSYREHAPGAALGAHVACFWELASSGEPNRVLPDGAMDVLFARGAGAARVVGTMTRAIVVDMGGPTWIVGVRFRPGAAIDLLGVSARELRDESACVQDVWGARGRLLNARLADAVDPGSAIRVIEQELESRIRGARMPDPRVARAVATLRSAGGELPIAAVAATAGVGERQLERLFHDCIGYGPKMFARVVRLQRSTRSIRRARSQGSLAS